LEYTLSRGPAKNAKDEATHAEQQRFVARLCAAQPEIQTAQQLANEFIRLVREREASAFEDWLMQTLNCGLVELEGFAQGLQRDREAVQAALALPWSKGVVEG
jgi:transposase